MSRIKQGCPLRQRLQVTCPVLHHLLVFLGNITFNFHLNRGVPPQKNLSQTFLKARGDYVNMFWLMKYNQKCNMGTSSKVMGQRDTWNMLLLLFLLCLLLHLSPCNMAVWSDLWQPFWTMRMKTSWGWKEHGFLRTAMGKNHHTNLKLPTSGLS